MAFNPSNLPDASAFTDWLRNQHRTSEANRASFGAVPLQQTPHGFSARGYGSRANMPSPLATGGAPAPNPLIANIPRAAPRAAPVATAAPLAPQVTGGNIPFAPQFDPRSGYGVGGMGGDLPSDGMWELIVAALMDKWRGVKKGKKKIKSRIDRNRVRRERRFDYEG